MAQFILLSQIPMAAASNTATTTITGLDVRSGSEVSDNTEGEFGF